MSDKYKGTIGPADAMGALDARFTVAYGGATDALLQAVLDFERATGRIVDSIELVNINVSTIGSQVPKTLRQASLHFLPKPGEIAW